MDLLDALIDRSLVIALAMLGAAAVSIGSLLGRRSGGSSQLVRLLVWGGYVVSFASVGLFIIAGFLKGR